VKLTTDSEFASQTLKVEMKRIQKIKEIREPQCNNGIFVASARKRIDPTLCKQEKM